MNFSAIIGARAICLAAIVGTCAQFDEVYSLQSIVLHAQFGEVYSLQSIVLHSQA
jgi:hypothetical protein